MDEYNKNKILEIKEITKKPFYLLLDESPDRLKRKVLNILFGELNSETKSIPIFFKCIEIESCISQELFEIVDFELKQIFNQINEIKNFMLLVTDRAAYCKSLGKLLKITYTNLVHVTCLCHALHNLADSISNLSPKTNKLIKYFKKSMNRGSKIRKLYKKNMLIKLPPFPIKTRWGTWINFVKWLRQNLDALKKFFEKSNLKKILKISERESFIKELDFLFPYEKLPEKIKYLEREGLSLIQCINTLKEVDEMLIDDELKTRFNEILSDNPGKDLIKNFTTTKKEYEIYFYSPLTTASVERSFSIMNNILKDRRNLSVGSLSNHLSIYYNKKKQKIE